eukprot:scaffold6.g2693.t1
MSTLAAARADGFYYPPGWDPKKGSLNKFHGSHGALGDRARKLDQGILIIRFEMPFNVWCAGCGHLIGKGVRFNAEKKQIGAYHSTKIWSFSMRAPCCQQRIEVHTDPKNAEYVVVSGARRKVESFRAEDIGTVELESAEERHAKLADPFSALEHAEADKRAAAATRSDVATLRAESEARHARDYELNKALRRQMRGARKEEQAADARRRALNLPDHVPLLPEAPGDALRAAAVTFGAHKFQSNWKKARKVIAAQGIFGGGGVAAAAAAARRAPAAAAGPGNPRAGGAVATQQQQQLKRRLELSVKLTVSEPEKRQRRS